MNGKDIFKAIGEINDNFIVSATESRAKKYNNKILKFAISIVACICLIVTGNVIVKMYTESNPKLSKLDSSAIAFEPIGLGLEGTDDLNLNNSDNINPWTKDVVIETLPVFKNLRYNNGKLSQKYYSADDLKKQTEIFAEALDLDIISDDTLIGEDDGEVYNYILQTKQGQVSTNGAGFSFNINKGYEYLTDSYLKCLYGEDVNLVTGVYETYSIDGEFLSEETRSYSKKGSIEENIIAFNLQCHYETENEKYINHRYNDYISSSVLYADYPIITWKEAQKQLLKGEYISAADDSQIIGGKLTEDAVYDVDLIYYTDGNPEFYIPYYRFYVKYYSGNSAVQRYVYYYVCAIDNAYIL